jgi:apolipoprotein N-acyltransferase
MFTKTSSSILPRQFNSTHAFITCLCRISFNVILSSNPCLLQVIFFPFYLLFPVCVLCTLTISTLFFSSIWQNYMKFVVWIYLLYTFLWVYIAYTHKRQNVFFGSLPLIGLSSWSFLSIGDQVLNSYSCRGKLVRARNNAIGCPKHF